MSLVPLISPDSEAEVLTMVALLEAYGVPVHVRGGGFGSLYPGPQEHGFNAKTIMVPEEALEDARRLLSEIPDAFPPA
jgi:FAD/FMN-containing dehydrogenase